eukprot:TRINITY_DN9594_c0_g1_i1.p1 TRINITY_DN9594_c0_g1~~TRINITY_DN9594_c0_g1_i1.p1  ORF type:complete len:337 (+),score=50.85 TRINITY_DN9594_c0_g1_i1:142-1152(+)
MQRIWVCVILCCSLSLALALTYENPIIRGFDNPDPGAIYADGKYYVATTGSNAGSPGQFPIHVSKNLVDWETQGSIFTPSTLPSCGINSFWAPEIHFVNGKYVAYFAARNHQGVLCVGVAVSQGGPLGPYHDRGSPLIANASMGNIDPTFWFEHSTQTPYLIWKEDGNGHSPQVPTNIYVQQLTKDGTSGIGSWHSILVNDPRSWEGPLVEGPWLMKANDTYYLFYSGNGYASTAYAIGVAQSKHILGPYVKYAENPIVRSDDHFSGPGHCSVLIDPHTHEWFFIYHSWRYHEICASCKRYMMMDGISWSKDNHGRSWPHLAGNRKGPSFGPQPVP